MPTKAMPHWIRKHLSEHFKAYFLQICGFQNVRPTRKCLRSRFSTEFPTKPTEIRLQEICHDIVTFYKLSPKYYFVGYDLRAKYPTIHL